ncbi:hypothetical protein Tco_0725749 [Tanacetum coccineum]|uniref:Secreted peptide n=1 Tax=Tanacetum coccineum TaxID=301880 RepID=A0ABQ4YDR2_9ASTR
MEEVLLLFVFLLVFPFRAFLHAFSSIVVSCLPPVSFLSTLACRLLLDDSCLPSLACRPLLVDPCLSTLACIETMKFLLLALLRIYD